MHGEAEGQKLFAVRKDSSLRHSEGWVAAKLPGRQSAPDVGLDTNLKGREKEGREKRFVFGF